MDLQALLQNADSGFAIANDIVLEDLQKALTAGYGTDAAAFTGGRALIPESLDTTLVSVLHTQEEAKLFQILKKEPVSSTVHEYNKRSEIGNDDGAWVPEGGDSEEKDQDIRRKTINMKYLQTLRKVTLQMTAAKTLEDAQALEQNAGTLWLIRNVEKTLFYGDSACVAEEFDGLDKLIQPANVIDLRGGNAASDTFESRMTEATRKIRDYYGKAGLFLSSTMVMEDVQALLRERVRVPVNQAEKNQSGAYVFDLYPTKFGKPRLEDDVFIREGGNPVASSLTAKRPSQVSIALLRQAATGGRVSKFVTADAGDYYYQVVAGNRYGDSVASTAVQVTGVQAGDEVEITITDGGTVGTYYKVYRSKKGATDGTDCRFMFRIAKTGTVVYDVNADLPGCSSSYLLTIDPLYNAIEWNQFLPMMKFPLYPTNAAVYPFLMLLFGALNLKKEEQTVRIKNIAHSTMGWF